MKKVYIKRNDLFGDIEMVLCNKVTEVDDSFIEDNVHLFYDEANEEDVKEEIERLSEIDWSREEYKPYDITDKMTPEEIKEHLKNFETDILCDLEPYSLEPYQYFACNLDDYQKENLESYGVKVGYSEALELHIIAIYDFGTSWSAFSYSKEVEDDYELAHNETLERSTVY